MGLLSEGYKAISKVDKQAGFNLKYLLIINGIIEKDLIDKGLFYDIQFLLSRVWIGAPLLHH